MKEMIKLPDGTWTYTASTPPADVNIDLPNGNIPVEEEKPRRKARERKAKP